MKLTFLGTGTSQGIPIVGCHCAVCQSDDVRDRRLRTSAFVEVDGVNILIDAGPDLRQQLLTHQICRVDALLTTHEHKDHIGGIDDIRPLNFMMDKTMPVYGLPRVLHVIHKDYDYAFKRVKYPGVPDLSLIPVHDEPFMIQHVQVLPIHVQHLALRILGYRIGGLAYITDANFISDKEMAKLADLDVLVINALRKEPHYSHFNLEQALEVIERLHPRKAYLTHVGHAMGKFADVIPMLPEHVFLAYDGQTLEW